jgi:hypothetical protein
LLIKNFADTGKNYTFVSTSKNDNFHEKGIIMRNQPEYLQKMKKAIIFACALSAVFMLHTACSETITADKPPYLRTPEGNRIPLNVQYIRTAYFYDSENPFPTNITIVSSTDELEEYYEKNRIKMYDGQGNQVPDENFLKAIEPYCANYFSDNFLVIVGLTEGSGSIRHRVVRIYENGDILIERLVPEVGTADMASWSILIELNNSFKKEQYQLLLPVRARL